MKKLKPVGMFIALLLGMAYLPYIPIYIFKINVDNLSQTVKVWYNFFCDIVFMIIIFLIYKDRIIKEFKDFRENFEKLFETSFKYYFIGLIVMFVSNLIISFYFKEANANNEETVRSLINLYPLYMLFSVSIYAPYVEETIFRRCIKDCMKPIKNSKIKKYGYALLSGLIFSLLHVVTVSSSAYDYLYVIPYFGLGFSFALLYYRTDNLFSSMSMHCLHNTAAIILYVVFGVM